MPLFSSECELALARYLPYVRCDWTTPTCSLDLIFLSSLYSRIYMDKLSVINALAALAHPIRLEVFRALVVAGQNGMTPGTMAEGLAIPANTLSFHLRS